jgi:hypothetical protein
MGYVDFERSLLPALFRDSIGATVFSLNCRLLLGDVLLGLPLPDAHSGWFVLWSALTIIVVVITYRGLAFLLGGSAIRKSWAPALAFALGYLGVHLVWMTAAPRYFVVLLPFVVIAWMIGTRGRSWLPRIAIAAVLILYGFQDASAWRESRNPPPENRAPAAALAFLRSQPAANAIVYAFNPYVVFLYTGLSSLSVFPAANPEALYAKTSAMWITDILLAPSRVTFMALSAAFDSTQGWPRQEQWVRMCPDLFEKVFDNEAEGTQVYRLRADAHFSQAYSLMSQASADIQAGHLERASETLKTAYAIDPENAGVLHRYGVTLLLIGQNPVLARTLLEKATHLRPRFALAYQNLALAETFLKHPEAARRARAAADALTALQ